jgi:hypothetical protein
LVRQKLLEICSQLDKTGKPAKYLYRDADNSGDEKKFIADVKVLARWGWQLYSRFIMDSPDDNFESKLEATLANPSSIQISSTRSARYVYPWSVVYDKALVVSAKNSVCPEFLGLFKQGKPPGFLDNTICPQNGCPHAADVNVVCPLRFWGFKHSIEQPPNAGAIVKEITKNGQVECVMGAHSALHGVQHCGDIERECTLTPRYAESKDDIKGALVSSKPQLIYFYCHGGRSEIVPWLGVGADEHIESADFKAWNARWPESHPLVIINGCHTVDLSPDDLLDFVTAFTWTRASGIIGTEICIPESLAREFGVEFLRKFLVGQSVAQALRYIRYRLLEKYNLLGLAYTPYCYGDLSLVIKLLRPVQPRLPGAASPGQG